MDTETFLSVIWSPRSDLISLITKIDNITFGVSFEKDLTQQDIYSIQNYQLIALTIQFNIYQPSMVPLLYYNPYDLAISNLNIFSILFKQVSNCQIFVQIMRFSNIQPHQIVSTQPHTLLC